MVGLSDFDYHILFVSGPTPGILYGFPEVHETGCPIRPILSALVTLSYNLAKIFFVPVLSPLAHNNCSIINSLSFLNKVINVNLDYQCHMASFDVKSLFANIPLTETINIWVELCKKSVLIPHSHTFTHFKSLLELALKESFFVFNVLYKWPNGIAVGFPLGSTLAMYFYAVMKKSGFMNAQ